MAVGLVAVVAACSGGGGAPSSSSGGSARAAWRPLAASPVAGRQGPATVWTGKEMLVWGGVACTANPCQGDGTTPLADGAAYDPVADRWRMLAPSPLSPRGAAAAVWTGSEMLVWGGEARTTPLADGAAYDPVADRWRMLAASPLGPRRTSGVWTGKELVVWGGRDAASQTQLVFYADGAAYDPTADRWRVLAPSPLPERELRGGMTWTGSEVVAWGGGTGDEAFADGAAWSPATDTWRTLARSPLAARFAQAIWTGKEVVVWGGEDWRQVFADGAAWDPAAGTWRTISPSPLKARIVATTVWTGSSMLVWGGSPGTYNDFFGDGAAYDPAADRWTPVPLFSGRLAPAAVWTGSELVVWSGTVPTGLTTAGLARLQNAADGARLTP
ncbi:MAG: Kelch repeat-containing protein [Acidimicrobiales bacterium]